MYNMVYIGTVNKSNQVWHMLVFDSVKQVNKSVGDTSIELSSAQLYHKGEQKYF